MLPHRTRRLASLLITLALFAAGPARALPPGYGVELIRSGLNFPVQIRFAPDGRLFYLERTTGRIMVSGVPWTTATPWATLPIETSGERGLLGMAFHPSFPDSKYVYVYHTNPSPLVNRVVRFTEQSFLGTNPIVFFDGIPANSVDGYHQGGRLAFGPDRMLYVTHGDRQLADDAQDVNSLNGKIFRLGPGGRPAPGNPFGPTNPAAVYGVRNPFGLCFDPRDGTGYFTENGPECDDEANLLVLGANYGWSNDDPCGGQLPGMYPPLASFSPTIAPTGCVVYRGNAYGGAFDGDLFFGSYNDGLVYRMDFQPGTVNQVALLEVFADIGEPVLDMTVGPEGRLWLSTPTSLWRINAPGAAAVGDLPLAGPQLAAAPNPFSRGIALTLSGATVERLEVLDIAGRRVRSLVAGRSNTVFWDGHDEQGQDMPAGIYLVRGRGPSGTLTRRVVKIGR